MISFSPSFPFGFGAKMTHFVIKENLFTYVWTPIGMLPTQTSDILIEGNWFTNVYLGITIDYSDVDDPIPIPWFDGYPVPWDDIVKPYLPSDANLPSNDEMQDKEARTNDEGVVRLELDRWSLIASFLATIIGCMVHSYHEGKRKKRALGNRIIDK